MKRHIQILFIFILVIFSINFYEARFLPEGFTRLSQFSMGLLAIGLSLPFSFRKPEGFILPIQLMFISIALSIVFAYISWSQSFFDSIKATVPYMLWIFVFYLLKIKFPIKTLEKIVLIYACLYIVLYFFQFFNSSTPYFGWNKSFVEDRGIIRVYFPGGGVFYLAVFMSLNKLTLKHSNKYFWAPFVLLGLVITVMQVTRQLIASVILIYIIHLTRDLNLLKKGAIILTFVVVIVLISTSNLTVIEGLKEVQEETSSQGKEYIRVVAGTYFLTEFPPNTISRIMGNGIPYGNKSSYGKFYTNIMNTKDYYLADVGLIAAYTMFGILSLAAFIMIWYKSFIIPVPKEYLYLKYYLWLLLFTSLTSYNLYHYNFLTATVFVLYIYQRIYMLEKREKQLELSFLNKYLIRK